MKIRATISRGKRRYKVGDFPDAQAAWDAAEKKAREKGWKDGYAKTFERNDA